MSTQPLLIVALPLIVMCALEAGELRTEGIGFIGPSLDGNDPETATCRNFGYGGSVGFPFRNRSLVVDLGRPCMVHRITLIDKIGLRIHATFRMNANYGMPMAKTFNGEFYWQHLDCRMLDKNGKVNPHLSYAYPEVRAFRLAILKEAAGYGVDGIHLDFLRHPPFFGYDKPLIEAFQAKYGADPKTIPEDKRWHQLRADVMTEFMRSVRGALDEVGMKTGKRVELSASFEYQNDLEQGLDVARWVKEGLVDNISPGVHGLGGRYFPIREFAKIVQGTDCKLFARLENIIQGHDPTPESERGEVAYEREHMTLNRYRARALEVYAEGGQGIYLFNTGDARLIDPLSDLKGLNAWRAFESPLVEWWGDGAEE